MTKQEVFEYLKDNLSLDISDEYREWGRIIKFNINLTDPSTGESVTIIKDSFEVYKEES